MITAVRASWLSARILPELVDESFELRDGAVLAPERSGLGLTPRRELVRAITVA